MCPGNASQIPFIPYTKTEIIACPKQDLLLTEVSTSVFLAL